MFSTVTGNKRKSEFTQELKKTNKKNKQTKNPTLP